jgi:hypothetical protein
MHRLSLPGFLSPPALTPGVMVFLIAPAAEAYIGPGLGAGAIAVVLGIIGAIIMAFIAILWYPLKRLLRKRGAAARAAAPTATHPDGSRR